MLTKLAPLREPAAAQHQAIQKIRDGEITCRASTGGSIEVIALPSNRNEQMAEALLADPGFDDAVIALDQLGFKIVPKSQLLAGERWPMHGDPPLTPAWATSAREQERMIVRQRAVAKGTAHG